MFHPKRKYGPKYQATSCSIRGVPLMIEIYTLTMPRTIANLDFLRSATIMPRGSDPISVRAKIRKVFHMPALIVESIVVKVI
jgi:hypothetical protein